jgi:hypothetical protein
MHGQEGEAGGSAGSLFDSALSFFWYPGGLILQVIALVHLFKRRGNFYWIWVIFLGGGIGALVYIAVEVVPDFALVGEIFRRQGRKSRIKEVETKIIDNPSAGNYEELAELYFDQREFAKAREACTNAIAARADSPHTFYLRAQCALELSDFAAAVSDLEHAVSKDGKLDSYRAAALLAHAYAMTGNAEHAAHMFGQVLPYSTTTETMYNYASFLKSQKQMAEAREWAEKILQKRRTMPRYQQRQERPWLRKTQALLKELRTA